MKKNIFILSLFLITPFILSAQKINLEKYPADILKDSILHYHLNSDTLFSDKQNVNIIVLSKTQLEKSKIDIAWSDSILKPTSSFGAENEALVAINGGFFDMSKGGSVTYLESDGKMVSATKGKKNIWSKTDSLLNGAIIVTKSGTLEIELTRRDSFYNQSDREEDVLVTGPLLLLNGERQKMLDSKFVYNKHPRTCICETESEIVFFTIDGRSAEAAGMNLYEVQDLFLKLGCINGINLDGGGSTTMWINNFDEDGVVNKPSDKTGERPVANAVLIMIKGKGK